MLSRSRSTVIFPTEISSPCATLFWNKRSQFQRSQRILREVFESIAYSNATSLASQFVRGHVVPAGTIFILPGIKD
jgi:hypothetical protein